MKGTTLLLIFLSASLIALGQVDKQWEKASKTAKDYLEDKKYHQAIEILEIEKERIKADSDSRASNYYPCLKQLYEAYAFKQLTVSGNELKFYQNKCSELHDEMYSITLRQNTQALLDKKNEWASKNGKYNATYFKLMREIAQYYFYNELQDTNQSIIQEMEAVRFEIALKYGKTDPLYVDATNTLNQIYGFMDMGKRRSELSYEQWYVNTYASLRNDELAMDSEESDLALIMFSMADNRNDEKIDNGFLEVVESRLNTSVNADPVAELSKIALDVFNTKNQTGDRAFDRFLKTMLREIEKIEKSNNEQKSAYEQLYQVIPNQFEGEIEQHVAMYKMTISNDPEKIAAYRKVVEKEYEELAENMKNSMQETSKEMNRALDEISQIDFFSAFKDQLIIIRDDAVSELEEKVNDFFAAYQELSAKKAGEFQNHIKYTRTLKYKPSLLVNYLETELKKDRSLFKNNDFEVLQLVQRNYLEAKELLSEKPIANMLIESAQLSEWGKYRDVLLRIALQGNQEKLINLFAEDEGQFITLNDILTIKGADFRSRRFIHDGIVLANNQSLSDYYAGLNTRKKELGELLLMSESELLQQGLTRDSIKSQVFNVRKDFADFTELLKEYIDFKAYSKKWDIGWDDIQKNLSNDQAFVDIERVNNADGTVSYLFFVIKKMEKDLIVLDSGNFLEGKAYTQHYNLVTRFDDNVSFDIYWAPVHKRLNGIKEVFISPDGIYHKINLQSLKNPSTKHHLLDEIEITRIYDISNLQEYLQTSYQESSSQGTYYLFGNPTYYSVRQDSRNTKLTSKNGVLVSTVSRAFSSNKEIPALEQTEVEINNIAEILTSKGVSYFSYLLEEASENNIKELTSPSGLHIATHGFFAEDLPVGINGNGFFSFDEQAFVENPMLRCGLLLSGGGLSLRGENNDSEDGILTAEEATHLNLMNTDIVVLSACETGLGQTFNGEGVMGLQRAFLIAGSQSVIMSLWQVDDLATQKLMTFFYRNWLQGPQSRHKAFYLAQKQLKEEYPLAKYWGAFTIVGF